MSFGSGASRGSSSSSIFHKMGNIALRLTAYLSNIEKYRFDSVANMKVGLLPSGDTLVFSEGQKVTTGATHWRITTKSSRNVSLGGELYAQPLNGVWVDDFISDRAVNCTAAFNEAILLKRKIRLTEGSYFVNDIAIKSEIAIEGPKNAFFVVDTAGAAVFLANTTAGDITTVNLKGFSAKTSAQQLGCAFYRQTSKANYTAYSQFNDIEIWLDFETGYDIFAIFCQWNGGRIGFSGNIPEGQTHQAVNSIPPAFGQFKQTNLNTMRDVFMFNATHPDGCVSIQYGAAWTFTGCDFESMDTRAIHALGIYGITINGETWFEGINANEVIFASTNPAPNIQGTRTVRVDGCFANLAHTNTRFITLGGASQSTVINTNFIAIPEGMELSNIDLEEAYGNQAVSGAGAATLLADVYANRKKVRLSYSEMLGTVINSPQTANTNMLPIGPTGLGAANFSSIGFTGKTDVDSELGLAGQAIKVLVSGGGDALWFTIPDKLRDFLEGKTVTFSLLGYGDIASNPTAGNAAVWESVTPTYANALASGSGLTTNQAQLQQGTLTHTVGTDLTSLHFGFKIGGISGSPPLFFESMVLMLGEIKPDGLSLR